MSVQRFEIVFPGDSALGVRIRGGGDGRARPVRPNQKTALRARQNARDLQRSPTAEWFGLPHPGTGWDLPETALRQRHAITGRAMIARSGLANSRRLRQADHVEFTGCKARQGAGVLVRPRARLQDIQRLRYPPGRARHMAVRMAAGRSPRRRADSRRSITVSSATPIRTIENRS